MIGIFACFGAVLTALIILVPQSIGLLAALQSGVIVSRGYGSAKIERSADAARFWGFWKARAARLLVPLIVLIVAGVFLAMQVAGFEAVVKEQGGGAPVAGRAK